jgi:flagellar export protein FliJ
VKPHEQDRGLAAVRRVRAAREDDSRIGLQRALAESRRRAEEADRLRTGLEAAPAFAAGSVLDFHRHSQRLTALAEATRAAGDAAATSARVADEAAGRWQHDRTEVRAVDLLLQRRAEVRAAERDRRETHELDDLAAVGWLRRRAADAETNHDEATR